MAESAEQVLASNPDQTGSGATRNNYTLSGTAACAEIFKPALPAGATAYTVTQATVPLSKGTGGTATKVRVEVRRLDAAGKPGGDAASVIEGVDVPLSSLASGTTPQPVTVNFTHATQSDPAKGVAVCVVQQMFSPTITVGCQSGGTQDPTDMTFANGSGAGPISWFAPQTGRDLIIEVKGTVTTP